MLRIELSPADLGRVRFDGAPALLLETALILFELDRRPAAGGAEEEVCRRRVAASLPGEARALVGMSRSSPVPVFLEVLTADAHEAIDAVREIAASVYAQNVACIAVTAVPSHERWSSVTLTRSPRPSSSGGSRG